MISVLRTDIFLRGLVFAVLPAVGACGGDREAPAPAAGVAGVPAAGVYRGQFPCGNCPGIEATLWLRSDGSFFVRRRYLADAGEEPAAAYNLGRWRLGEAEAAIALDGRGPVRTYRRTGPDQLEFETGSKLPHRLVRDPAGAPFTDALRVAGTARVDRDGARFRECRTGLDAPIARTADYRRFLHQYRSAAAPGTDARVEFDGRFSWAAGGAPSAVTIERFVSAGDARACGRSGSGAADGDE